MAQVRNRVWYRTYNGYTIEIMEIDPGQYTWSIRASNGKGRAVNSRRHWSRLHEAMESAIDAIDRRQEAFNVW